MSKDKNDRATAELAMPRRKSAGRPALYDEPMTPAARARRYRSRKMERANETVAQMADANDARLIELLKLHLPATTRGKKKVAGWVIAELAKRYPEIG